VLFNAGCNAQVFAPQPWRRKKLARRFVLSFSRKTQKLLTL